MKLLKLMTIVTVSVFSTFALGVQPLPACKSVSNPPNTASVTLTNNSPFSVNIYGSCVASKVEIAAKTSKKFDLIQGNTCNADVGLYGQWDITHGGLAYSIDSYQGTVQFVIGAAGSRVIPTTKLTFSAQYNQGPKGATNTFGGTATARGCLSAGTNVQLTVTGTQSQ